MARVDTLPHFLTDVADAIRTKKGSSDTILASDFDTEIENLPSGGGNSSKAFCRGITSNVSDNTTSMNIMDLPTYRYKYNGVEHTDTSNLSYLYNKPAVNKGIIVAFVRSEYTLSNDLELLAESEWFTADNLTQKLLVCWYEGGDTTITQANSGRMEMIYVSLMNAKKPTSANVFVNTINTNYVQTSYVATATNNLCIFVESSIYQISSLYSSFIDISQFDYVNNGYRLVCETTSTAGQKNLIISNSVPTAIIGIEVQVE